MSDDEADESRSVLYYVSSGQVRVSGQSRPTAEAVLLQAYADRHGSYTVGAVNDGSNRRTGIVLLSVGLAVVS